MQVILKWRCLEGSRLHRVVTRRLNVTSSLQAVLTATDWSLASVVSAKVLVQEAQVSGAAQDRRAAEALRKHIGRLCSLSVHLDHQPDTSWHTTEASQALQTSPLWPMHIFVLSYCQSVQSSKAWRCLPPTNCCLNHACPPCPKHDCKCCKSVAIDQDLTGKLLSAKL